MMNDTIDNNPKLAWINGRETYQDSLVYGEVVVHQANVWQHAGGLPQSGKIVGKLEHGTQVTVIEKRYIEEIDKTFFKIASDGLEGWIAESFVSWMWSSFTFIGSLSPSDACAKLSVNLEYAGMHLLILQSEFAIVTEGDPGHFDSIEFSAKRFIERITNAQTPLSVVAMRADFKNWIEVPFGSQKGKEVVGFLTLESERSTTVSTENIETAHSLVPLMTDVPYLDLALSDLSQALSNPQHALIFLARSIESIENHFQGMADKKKKIGKEKVMREMLGLSRADVEYVTKRANESHRRHASRDARAESLPPDELAECFKKTSMILSEFVTYLRKIGFE